MNQHGTGSSPGQVAGISSVAAGDAGRRVVMVSYFFPPEGNAATYRPLRFVRHLSREGWHPTVITLDTDRYERLDPELLEQVPAGVRVLRVPNPDPWRAFQAIRARCREGNATGGGSNPGLPTERSSRRAARELVRRVEALCYHPDMEMCWIRPVIRAIDGECLRHPISVLWATGRPWSSFVAVREASRRTGVPYVLDFRDSWTLAPNDVELRRPRWLVQRDRRLLYGIFKTAQAIVFRYHAEAETYLRAYSGALDPRRIHIIPNGYDGRVESTPLPAPPPVSKHLTLLYTGTISPYRYDTLLEALAQLLKSHPQRAHQLRLVIVGEGGEEFYRDACSKGTGGMIEVRPPVSQSEVLRLQSEADVLLLLGVKQMPGLEFCGSKVFNYLRAGRPILGILPRDETRAILDRVGVTTVACPDSVSDIVAMFQTLLERWHAGTLSTLLPDPEACEVYSAQRQTESLIRALEGAPPAEPFVPGAASIPPSLRFSIGDRGWFHEDGLPA